MIFLKEIRKIYLRWCYFKKIYCILYFYICIVKMNILVRKGKNINYEKLIVEIFNFIILFNFKVCVMIFKKIIIKIYKIKIDLLV